MALVLKINGTDRSSFVDWKSLVKTEVLTKEVDRLEFFIRKTSSKTIPNVNDVVILEEDSVKIFGGILIEKNFKGKSKVKIESLDWAKRREKK